MKMIIDIRKLSNKPSGIGMYIYNFVKGLLKYSDLELVGITDVLISKEILELKSLNLNIIEYGKEVDNNFEVFKYFKFIEKIIEEENPEYFWEPNFIIPINLKKRFRNVKLMITIFDLIPILNPNFCSLKYRIYFKYFLYKTIKNVDSVIYISDTVKEQCENTYWFIKNKKSLMNYVIIDGKDNINKKELNDSNYFLFIGNIEERKGIRILIDAYTLYIKKGGTKKLKIVGSIRDEKIETLINEQIAINNKMIEYLGYVNESEKNNLMENSSALIFPSYAEGFGIPPVEALMLGKPVIVSNIEIFKEILGVNGNYFDIKTNYENSVNMLCDKMFDYKISNYEEREKLMQKYECEKLTKNLIKFIHSH